MKALTDDTMMIRPRCCLTILATARLVTLNTPVRLVSMTSDHDSSLMRRTSVSRVMPALATSTSTGPHASSMAEYAAVTCSGIGHVAGQRHEPIRAGVEAVLDRAGPRGDRHPVPAGQEPVGAGQPDAA